MINMLSTLLTFIVYVVISGSGLIILKIALNETSLSPKNIVQVFLSVKFLIGFSMYASSFLMFMFILSKFKLNVAYPLATALFFVYISLASYFILKESFSAQQVIGIVFCMLGVILIGLK